MSIGGSKWLCCGVRMLKVSLEMVPVSSDVEARLESLGVSPLRLRNQKVAEATWHAVE